jgi:hypothetical protein
MNLINTIRTWIKANIIGDDNQGGYKTDLREPALQKSTEEKIQAAMDATEFMYPDPFLPDGGINIEFIKFWVSKFLEFVVSGLVAGFTWLVLKMTGKQPLPEQEGAEAVATIVPAIVWVLCFIALVIVRRRKKGKPKPL